MSDEEFFDLGIPLPPPDAKTTPQVMGFVFLIELYDGDPDAWLKDLATPSIDHAHRDEAAFAQWVTRELESDPALLSRIRMFVSRFRTRYLNGH